MKFPTQGIKSVAKKFLSIALPVFSTLFLVGTTAVILVIVNGYSIDISKKQLIKTGVLNIETNPSDASININGQYSGNTNRAIPNLTTGDYSISLTKEGYYTYNRNVEVKHGLATIIVAPLIKQTGAEAVAAIGTDEISFSNESGLYLLASADASTSAVVVTGTATPKPTTPAEKSYTLTKFTVTKNFFDPPKPSALEKVTLTLEAGLTISSYSVSPTGKSVLIVMQNAKGQKTTAIISFKNGDTIKVSQFLTQPLDSYIDEKDTKVTWAKNADYIVVETSSQVITFNIKTATRIILFDKPISSKTFVWNTTDTGVVIVKNEQEDSLEYDVEQISFNGNAIESVIQKASLPEKPLNIWANTTDNKTVIVVSAEKGTYLFGNFYDNRVGEYEVTSSSTKIDNRDIQSLGKNLVLIKIHDAKVTQVQFVTSRFMISYTDNQAKNLYTYTYNKRAAEHYVTLGEKTLISNNETELRSQKWIFSANYLIFESNRNLWAIDYTGTNLYQLQEGVNIPTFFLEDSTLLYKGDDSKIYFKTMR